MTICIFCCILSPAHVTILIFIIREVEKINTETLEGIKELSIESLKGYDSFAGRAPVSDEECAIVHRILGLLDRDNIESFICEWLDLNVPVAMIAVATLTMFNVIIRTELLATDELKTSARERFEKLLEHSSPIIRLRAVACLTFMHACKMVSDPAGLAVALKFRMKMESCEAVREEYRELLAILPDSGKNRF